VEGVDFEDTFVPISRLAIIKLFLAFACFRKFKFYKMDANSTFLNGDFEEEVYCQKLEKFQLSENEDYICRLKKSHYGLKYDPKALLKG